MRFLLSLIALPLVGCAVAGPSASTFSLRAFPDMSVNEAFAAGEAALIHQGYDLDRRDPSTGTLVTRPLESGYRERYGNQARRLGTEGRQRRVAKVQVAETPRGAKVYCRVTVEEQSTQVYRFLAESYRTGVSEESTAIDRDAATTARQNTVWRTVDRDRPAERAILDAIAPPAREPGSNEGEPPAATQPAAVP